MTNPINTTPKRQTLSLKVNDCFSHLNASLETVHLRVEDEAKKLGSH